LKINKYLLLFLCAITPLAIGGLSAYLSMTDSRAWYSTLNKPFFTPPSWIFGPAWSVLYVLMGITWYLLLKAPKGIARLNALRVFYVQLVLNFLWSILFFRFHWIELALIEIAVLWICIILLIFYTYKTHKLAAIITLPYLLWVSFATALNAAIWWLN
jgi:tryptophan-rich sensory protein